MGESNIFASIRGVAEPGLIYPGLGQGSKLCNEIRYMQCKQVLPKVSIKSTTSLTRVLISANST